MELKSRQVYILEELTASREGLEIHILLEKLQVTRRTLYYDLEKINHYLKDQQLGLVSIDENHIVLQTYHNKGLLHELERHEEYYYSIEERRAMEVFCISLSHVRYTLDVLAELFDVSKNTVLTDIKMLKKELQTWKLKIISHAQSGYRIIGEEKVLRKMLQDKLQRLTNPGIRFRIKTQLRKTLCYYSENDIDFYEICRCIIKQYEIDTKGEFFLGNMDAVCLMMQMAWIRSIQGFSVSMNLEEEMTLMNTVSFRSLEISSRKLDQYDINLSQKEIYYMTVLFLGIQTTDFVSREQEDAFIESFAKELIENFERVSCMSFQDRDRLIKKLNYHIRPLYYRMKYGLETVNPLVHDVKKRYPALYYFAKKAFEGIQSEASALISEDEIAYLCIYFASHLNEKKLQNSTASSREMILIVGIDNMATTTLVKEQLQELFGGAFSYHITVESKLKSWTLKDYVLIICIGHGFQSIERYQNRCIEVEPILTETDRRKLMDAIEKQNIYMEKDPVIRSIIKSAQHHSTGTIDKVNLYFDLFRLLEPQKKLLIDPVEIIDLQDKIKNGEVLNYKHLDWDMLLSCGCTHLVGDSRAKRLIERMKLRFREHVGGLYQIRKHVILVHCPMHKEIGGSIDECVIITETPVLCPGELEARIFLFFSTVDNYSHWNTLMNIYTYFDELTHISELLEVRTSLETE